MHSCQTVPVPMNDGGQAVIKAGYSVHAVTSVKVPVLALILAQISGGTDYLALMPVVALITAFLEVVGRLAESGSEAPNRAKRWSWPLQIAVWDVL
jgi:hypothetical protein